MKIAVCEDNPVEAGEMERILKNWAEKRNMDLTVIWYPTAEAFWFAYEEKVFDALFLDIQMPGEDGISLAGKLRERGDDIPIVFVTGMEDYISQGYDVEAIHYLLKPVQEEKAEQCMERICRRQGQAETVVLLDTEEGIIKLRQSAIIKIEVFGRECTYTTSEGSYRTARSMKQALEGLSPKCFVSCHRGVLVNLQRVESISHDKVVLSGGVTAPISRRRYRELNRAFIDFFRS